MFPETPDRPRAPRGLRWAAWALTAVAVLLPVVLLVVHQRILGGALDGRYFASTEYDAAGNEVSSTVPDVGFWDRWGVVTYTAPADRALLASAAVCVLLAGLHLAAGARWPLPRACRWTAAGAGALSALCAATVLVVQLVRVQLPDSEGQWFTADSTLLDLASPVSAMVTVVVFCVVAGAVLLGPALPRAEAAEAAEEPGEPGEPEGTPGVVTGVTPEPERAPEPEPAEVVLSFPHPTAEQYAQYRRPGA